MARPDRQTPLEPHDSDRLEDQEIERLVSDIGAVIRSADLQKRSELKELAEALLRDEISSIPEDISSIRPTAAPERFSPLFPGILLTLFGLGFFLLFPFVGAALAAIGIALAIWGVVLSGARK